MLNKSKKFFELTCMPKIDEAKGVCQYRSKWQPISFISMRSRLDNTITPFWFRSVLKKRKHGFSNGKLMDRYYLFYLLVLAAIPIRPYYWCNGLMWACVTVFRSYHWLNRDRGSMWGNRTWPVPTLVTAAHTQPVLFFYT